MSVDEIEEPTSTAGKPLTKRGEKTRARLLEAAEHVFADQGYHEASIVKITERAGIGLGTFYLYFDSKQAIFEALALDLNRRVRHAMSEEMAGAASRLEAERAGFAGFFRFTSEHPALYRVVREAEYVSPGTMREHYQRIVSGYEEGLRRAQAEGDVDPGLDPEVTAWTLMGIGELVGMRYLLWERTEEGAPGLPDDVFESVMRVVRNALTAGREG
ncbi:TetR/AcrR family transcriptional regulator [Demequina sp. SYSU T00192]|uniref:TetR/AcrR family transcriptional regulator n=1 Tax=Demequina litoralis TaxID=3051660 RepID=A0ABT8G5H7_9MICO|nr:TetR/AcrR family transcriptional regulator [Demequina sp. SYSU T00192]MDN4474327.1 TetR/AcrR family transcriptional regulator [Demequina sp. SYSU T00192]